jgi:hypothetical protein
MITTSANRYMSVLRQTSFIMDAASAAATMSVDRSVANQVTGTYAQVVVSGGTTGSGTVTISGTDTSGAATSETLTYTSNGTIVTTKKWSTITGVTTTGLEDEATVPTVSVAAVSADGVSNLIRKTIVTGRPALLVEKTAPGYPATTAGTKEVDKAVIRFDFEEVWRPRVDDLLVDAATSEEWLAVGCRLVGFGLGKRHWYVESHRYQT